MNRPEDCTTLRKLNLIKWHKIKWKDGPHAGKMDLMRDDTFEKYKPHIETIETIQAESCAKGIRLGWGLTEEKEIDTWIKANRIK